jgi:alpha-tubulin suppressor-like RCC1 family protein
LSNFQTKINKKEVKKMGGRKKFGSLFFLVVGITVFFGLSSTGCKKKSAQTGQQGFPSSTTGQTGYPSTSTGGTGFPTATTFTNPDDAATKTFGSLSVASDNIITARASQSEMITGRMITGRMITGRAITARIITGRIITARSPKFINVIGNDNEDDEDDILNLFGRLKKSRLSKKQSEGSEISCEDVKPKCVEGKVEKADCNKDQSTNRLNFDIKLSDCKEIVDEQKGDYIVSTGYAKGYLEISTKVSQNISDAKFIFAIEDGDSLVKEFIGNKETKRVRAKSSKFRTEITGRFIEGEKDVDFGIMTKLSGSYSREDEIGKRKEAYSYNDYVVELTGKSPKSGGEATFHISIAGGYSVDTEPASCVEGVFNFKTIKPIKSSGGQGYCGAESGEIEVNNAKMEFSSGKVKVSVENQQKEYRCEELGVLCKYEPITIAEGVEKKPCPVWFKDADKDGYTDGTTKVSCEKPSDEYVSSATAGDCNDADSSMNPGRTEICDGKDNNCNGQIDEGFNVGQSCTVGVGECARTGQYVCNQDGTGTECNATPGTPTPEVCDGLDNDCDGQTDEGVLLVFYRDQDGDGYGYANNSTQACSQPTGYVSNSSDCDDNNANLNPSTIWFKDADFDGFYPVGGSSVSCNNPFAPNNATYVAIPGGDCNDTNPFIYPGAPLNCNNGQDNDCSGNIEKWAYTDQDGDRYAPNNISSCVDVVSFPGKITAGQELGYNDCNDNNPNVNPGKSEMCNGIDDNCNGQTDEGNVCGIAGGAGAKVGAGWGHTCAIKQDGSLWCWGWNGYGQLGDGTNTSRNTPVQIMSSGVTSVSLGDSHTCAIKQDGSLWCWGNNYYRQLGDGTNTIRTTPVQIMSSGVSSVALGGYHTCAVKTDGSLWCWGRNDSGQLGDGTYTDRTTPVQIMSSGVSSVALGYAHTCAVRADGSLWCWGRNDSGQLGDGTYTDRTTPVQIMSSGVSSVALGGGHTCAVKTDGSLWCWGRNDSGQLGDGTWTGKNTPVQIMSSGVSSVALGGGHTCAVKTDGSLWCWGYNNSGQLGDGTWTDKTTPVQIMSSGVSSVALGGYHTCAVKTDGSLWCWGNNDSGQLGDGTYTDRTTPVQIMSSGVSSVALGDSHTCAVKIDGSLWCWGYNNSGQLGDGTNTSRTTPVQIMSSGVSSVALGYAHTCAVKTDGSLWCWGYNGSGQLGDGTNADKTTPVQIMSSGVSSVALGKYHTCAVKTDGSLWCWGYNGLGQLGDGTNANETTPVQIMSSGVSSVALGGYHTCAVKTDGSLWCWGYNNSGQLGDGTNTSRTTPVQIMSSGVSSVALGGGHTCAVKTDGSLWCWGWNGFGQLGDGTWTDKNTPVQIMSSGVSSVALGDSHTCAIKQDGSLWCWGNNWFGQLGDGTSGWGINKNTPVQIMSSGVSSVALGGYHTCAVKTDGSLWCWGRNNYGQLGDGGGWKNTPVYIMNLGSGGGGAPSIRDESSFGNREQKQANIEQKHTRYGCSSANIVFYVLHLIFPAFILFALYKRRFFVRN